MRRSTFVLRSFTWHARSHLTVMLSCAVACAIITGALLVGDSVRGSLRDRALERLGGVALAATGPRFFREELAADLAGDPELAEGFRPPVPAIILRGTVDLAGPEAGPGRASGVRILGIDERFEAVAPGLPEWGLEGRSAVVNAAVARELDASAGDDVLVHFQRASEVALESVLGNRDETVERLRLTLGPVQPDAGAALFSLRHEQQTPQNVFVPLDILQRALDVEGRANSLLFLPQTEEGAKPPDPAAVAGVLDRQWTLADAGLRVREDRQRGYAALESREFFLADPWAQAGRRGARRARLPRLEALAYITKLIERPDVEDERPVPYSVVVAASPWVLPDGTETPSLAPASREDGPPPVLLSQWTEEDLGAQPGDPVDLTYWEVGPDEELVERTERFEVSGLVPLEGVAADPGWTPEYPGITDVRIMGSWEVPFDIDRDLLDDRDETFWEEHNTTPKAFVPLATGRRLWKSRFGTLTSVRVRPPEGGDLGPAAGEFRRAVREALRPADAGVVVRDVREEALRAARTGTDFAVLFLALSLFIIVSALLLVAMTFRLAIGRRARELGMLRALGFASGTVQGMLLLEGALVAVVGIALGLLAGAGYAAGLIAGLRTMWEKAVNAPFLKLHLTFSSFAIAAVATAVLVLGTTALVVRGLVRRPPRGLLAGRGAEEEEMAVRGSGRGALAVALAGLGLGLGLLAGGLVGVLPQVPAFLGIGFCLLIAVLAAYAWWGRRPRRHPLAGRGAAAIARLGALEVRRAPRRSLLTSGLIASASFIIVTVASMHHDPRHGDPRLDSGDGGFAVLARAANPLYADLDSSRGRERLALNEEARAVLARPDVRGYALRERPGDETSCRNLYRPEEPRVLGLPPEFIERDGFVWASSLAETEAERENPWRLLEREISAPPGEGGEGTRDAGPVVPAVGDYNTVRWILKAGLGDEIPVTGGRGQRVRLRIVGLLQRSIFQDGLLVAEDRFLELFPGIDGHSTFLFECPSGRTDEVVEALESLAAHGVDARTTGEVLLSFQQVENTYLETFFILGGLGLVLGTLGLGATLLRSVLERRAQLALLRALGWSRRALAGLVLAESLALLVAGLVAGAVPALVAVLPSLGAGGGEIPWHLLAGLLALVVIAGAGSCLIALVPALRTPLLPALRAE